MKKLISLSALALALSIAMPAHSQTQFGVKAGFNITSMKFKDMPASVDPDNRCGFFIGPTVDFKLPLLGIGMDASLLYNQKVVGSSDDKLKQNLLSIPLNFKGSIGLGNTLGIYGAVGPQFDFNIGDKKWKDVGDLDMEWKGSSVSLNLGAGVKLFSHIQAGVTYNIGLSKTAEYCGETASSVIFSGLSDAIKNANAKTNTWMIHVAYMF